MNFHFNYGIIVPNYLITEKIKPVSTTCIRISEAVALAFHTLGVLVRSPEQLVSNQDIAGSLKVSSHHLAKVHQRLVHNGIIKAVRGPSGGFQLAKPANEILLMEVVQAIEGNFEPDQCLLGRPACQRGTCVLGKLSASINHQVREFLITTTVDQLGL